MAHAGALLSLCGFAKPDGLELDAMLQAENGRMMQVEFHDAGPLCRGRLLALYTL